MALYKQRKVCILCIVYYEKKLHNKYIFLWSQTKLVEETTASRIPCSFLLINIEKCHLISTKRENIPDSQHCECGGRTRQHAWCPTLPSFIAACYFFPRRFTPLPYNTLLNAWDRLEYSILAKCHLRSRWQSLPRTTLAVILLSSFEFSHQFSHLFCFIFFLFDRKYLRDNERHYLARKVRNLKKLKKIKIHIFKSSLSVPFICVACSTTDIQP